MNSLTTAGQRLNNCAPTECPECGRDFYMPGADEDDLYGDSPSDPADQIHAAAHCCLWKARDHAARVRIAERVETGSTWAEAIKGEDHAH